MLRSNSKVVKDKIKKYIMDNFENYHAEEEKWIEWFKYVDITDYSQVCAAILRLFFEEKIENDCRYKANKFINRYEYFEDWTSGLCSAINTSYWYGNSAKDLLKDWLEESDEEADRFSENEAEVKVTQLLWRELNQFTSKL